jgi:hypothetical protein
MRYVQLSLWTRHVNCAELIDLAERRGGRSWLPASLANVLGDRLPGTDPNDQPFSHGCDWRRSPTSVPKSRLAAATLET